MKKIILIWTFFVMTNFVKAQSVDGGLKTLTASGTNTYTITEALPAAYDPKERFLVRFTNANTGPVTLNRAGLGAKAIKKIGGSDLIGGEIPAGSTLLLSYNGTYYQVVGASSGAGTVTSVAASIGTAGTDFSVSGSPITSSGTLTFNLPTASASNRGALSTSDWSTFNGKYTPSGSQGDLPYYSGSNTLANLTKSSSATRYLSNTGTSNNPAWAQVNLTNGVTGLLPYGNFSDGSGLSIVGRSANTSGVQADIAAGSDYNILRRSGNSIGFGSIDLSQSGAVGSSILPIANGGTGSSSFTGWLLASGGTLTGANTITGTTTNTLKGVFNSLGTTVTDGAGLYLQNSTSAAAGAQQISPILTFEGNGWKTNATAASQVTKAAIFLSPTQSTTSPTFSLVWQGSVNASAYENMLSLDWAGAGGNHILTLSGGVMAAPSGKALQLRSGNILRTIYNATSGQQDHTFSANSGGSTSTATWTAAAHTSQSTGTDIQDIYFNLNRTVQYVSGAKSTQRSFLIDPPVHSATGATTITRDVGVSITGPPKAGTNVTITTAVGLDVATRDVSGGSGVTTAYGLYSNAPSGATTNYALGVSGDIDVTTGIDAAAGDAATINGTGGRFRKDTSGSTFTLTNSYITANSIIILTFATTGLTTGYDAVAVAGSGSATITFQTAGVAAAPSANADVNFIVLN